MSGSTRIPAPKLWVVLARCHRAMSSVVEESIAKVGLSLSDFQVIETLLHKGPLTITELQGKVLLASGSMTAAVDRAEKKGLLVRTNTTADRRARRLELTAKGRRVAQSVFKAHAEELEALMGVLQDEEMRALYGPLKKLGLSAAELLDRKKELEK